MAVACMPSTSQLLQSSPVLTLSQPLCFSYSSVIPDETVLDTHGHGTHCAGTIGAKDTGSGIVGVAPGAPILAIKVSGSGPMS